MARRIGIVMTLAILAALFFSVQGAGAVTAAERYQEIQNTIDGGIHWLIDNQNPDGSGSWGDSSRVAKTGYVILKLMDRSREIGESDPLSGKYGTEIQEGLNFLFSKVQAGGYLDDPGSIWDFSPYDPCAEDSPRIVYETSIAIMAITNTRTPGATVAVPGGSPVNGKTYKQVVEGAVNYLESAQIPDDPPRYGLGFGGWSYFNQSPWPLECTSKIADQMNSGYAVQALAYAKDPRNGFNIAITDQSFRDNLAYWVTGIQDVAAGGAYDCISDPDFGCDPPMMNIWQTGNLLIQQKYLGYAPARDEVKNATTYIWNNWTNTNSAVGWLNSVQAMYTTTAGLQAFDLSKIPIGGVHDWFADFEDTILTSKVPGDTGGFYWEPDSMTWPDQILSTELTLNTLEGWVYPAQMDVILTVTPDAISPGDQATCTIEVTNNGESAVYGLGITESSDTGTEFGLSGVEPVVTNGDNDLILEPGETWTYTKGTDIPATFTDTITASGEDIRGREVKEERTVIITVSQECGTAELCGDGIDNNCNGQTDEGFPNLGQSCTVGTGACEASGHYVCSADKLTTVCDASEGTPTAELCGDGIDNNCDGVIDENCGCTGTAGYWLNHPCVLDQIFSATDGGCGYTFSVGEDGVQVLTANDAQNVLELDPGACARCERIVNKKTVVSENPLNQLYRQTLAAELAIHNCIGDNAADPTAVQTTLSAAEAFLNDHPCDAGCSLRGDEKAQVSGWNTILDQFNAGTLSGGPLECTTFPCRKA